MSTLKQLLETYEIDQTESLDPTNFGSIYAAKERATGQTWAIKLVETHPQFDKGWWGAQYETAQLLDHPNLLPYHAYVRLVDGMVTNVFKMPLIEAGDLTQHWDLAAADKKLIADQVLDALYYLHAQGVVWQCLSAQHILLQEEMGNWTPLLINYGHKEVLPLALYSNYAYLAPEQLEASTGSVDPRTDIWAYGVFLYQLWTGQLPFGTVSTSLPNSKIQARILGDWEPGLLAQIPEPYQKIAKKCLNRKKEARWTSCGEIIAEIKLWQNNRSDTITTPTETVQEAASNEGGDERRFLRKPSRPIVWWQVLLIFVLAALLGYWVGG